METPFRELVIEFTDADELVRFKLAFVIHQKQLHNCTKKLLVSHSQNETFKTSFALFSVYCFKELKEMDQDGRILSVMLT